MTNNLIKLTESPRDALQGLPYILPVSERARYINDLMEIGFDVIDFGSFVSPKHIPQMEHSDEVLSLIHKSKYQTKLMAIVGNTRGAEQALIHQNLDIIEFPYSISNTFLEKNINSNIDKIFTTTQQIAGLCNQSNKKIRVFISMAFGNPYGDFWTEALLIEHIEKLINNGIKMITLSDTVGLATPKYIFNVFQFLLPQYPNIELGLHLHTQPNNWEEKIESAWDAGCRSYDGVINGIGGCPMTGYELMGNINTLDLIDFFTKKNIPLPINTKKLSEVALRYSNFEDHSN